MAELQEAITHSDRWFRGYHKVFEYTVRTRAGVAVDISDFAAFEWGVYDPGAGRNATPKFPVKTLGAGITVTDGPGGVLQVTVEPTDTEAMVPTEYQQRLSGEDADGLTDVLVVAKAVLRQAPTD
jgi:hypothetical protein